MKLKLHEVTEIAFDAPSSAKDYYSNFYGVFTCKQKTLNIPAYCKGDGKWAVHFSPNYVGEWTYTIVDQNNGGAIVSGKIEAVDAQSGALVPLTVVPAETRPMFYHDNKPYFVNAYECNWLFAIWMKDKEGAKRLIENICTNKFNGVVINVYAHSCEWTKPDTAGRLVPPPVYCWGGSNEQPNFDVLNEDFYSQFDEMFAYLQEKKLFVYLYYFVYNKAVAYPERNSEQEKMYIKQICARYQAYPNTIWIYAKELYFNSDKENIIDGLQLIRDNDAYRRLSTFHDDRNLMYNPRARALTDFHTIQQHAGFFEYTSNLVWNDNRPVFNAEFGYEPGDSLEDKTYTEVQNIREFIMRAWHVAFAGAGICYYYTFTGWDVIRPDDVPPGYAMFKALYEYFETIDWWNFIPFVEFPMWSPTCCIKHKDSEKYLFITTHHGNIQIDRPINAHTYKGSWLNPFTGEKAELLPEHIDTVCFNKDATVFTSPFKSGLADDHFILQLEII